MKNKKLHLSDSLKHRTNNRNSMRRSMVRLSCAHVPRILMWNLINCKTCINYHRLGRDVTRKFYVFLLLRKWKQGRTVSKKKKRSKGQSTSDQSRRVLFTCKQNTNRTATALYNGAVHTNNNTKTICDVVELELCEIVYWTFCYLLFARHFC